MNYGQEYLEKCQVLIAAIAVQELKILETARLFIGSILAGRMVQTRMRLTNFLFKEGGPPICLGIMAGQVQKKVINYFNKNLKHATNPN